MTKITAAEINKLRQATGAGMMDCKKALTENEGDFQAAIDWLRKKGQKVADKRSDREANEGFVVAKVTEDKAYGAVIMINCETDFVAKNEDFVKFANSIIDLAVNEKPADLEALKALQMDGRPLSDHINEQVAKIGEKIDVNMFKSIEAPIVFAYNHNGNRLATIMGLNKADVAEIEQIGKEVNMQIAAMAPVAIDKDGIDEDIIKREMEIGMEQARAEGKPEAMLEKIATGKLNKFYKERTLLNQEFVRDNKKTIKQYLSEADKELTVSAFHRVNLGE